MSYRLKVQEPLQAGVRRVAVERIDSALASLEHNGSDAEGIHDARKRFKETRALLRLVRAPLGATYRAEHSCFRALGRRLSAARDAQAMVETFDKLAERFPDRLEGKSARAAREGLLQRLDTVGGSDEALSATVQAVREALGEARQRTAAWKLETEGFAGIAEGLGRIYRDGRRRMDEAYAKQTDAHFHEWRKRIKDHWYHTRLLRTVWDPVMAARQGELKALSECIGDDHDLSVLQGTLRRDPEAMGSAGMADELTKLAARRQTELRARARLLGRRLYSEKPGAFVRRMAAYWAARLEEAGR